MLTKFNKDNDITQKILMAFFIVCFFFIGLFALLAISNYLIQVNKTENLVCTIYTDNVDYNDIDYDVIERNVFNTRIFFKDSNFNEITIVDNYVQECKPE